MEYLDLTYEGAKAQVALFDNGRKEAHAYIASATPSPNAFSQIKAINDAARKLAAESGLRPVFKRYLLSDPVNQIHYIPQEENCAFSVLGQSPLNGTKAALLIILEENADFLPHESGLWEDSNGRIWVGDSNDIATGDSLTMTVAYLERLSRILAQRGASLKDNCLRTWFFVRDIDNSYKGVVEGRNRVFALEGLTSDTHFIASTGIEAQSADHSRIVAFNAFADTRISKSQIKYLHGRSHLNPTFEYGVAFERATAVDYADRRHVYISGTASIDNQGRIVAPGDVKAQTDRMLENIGVLLAEGDCEWEDVAHMTVYIRDIADYALVSSIMTDRFPDIPKIIVLASVCRSGWLVETECMAIKKADNPEYEAY